MNVYAPNTYYEFFSWNRGIKQQYFHETNKHAFAIHVRTPRRAHSAKSNNKQARHRSDKMKTSLQIRRHVTGDFGTGVAAADHAQPQISGKSDFERPPLWLQLNEFVCCARMCTVKADLHHAIDLIWAS